MSELEELKEQIEEVDGETIDAEIEYETRLNLIWVCPKCGEGNVEYNVGMEGEIICKCDECGKKYSFYHCEY